jgi:beta-lactamase regulating signal transducer with metallopeptidase domain
MDVTSILVLSLCVLIPFIGAITIIAVVPYKAKLASSIEYFNHHKAEQSSDQAESKLPKNLKLYIYIMLFLIGSLACLMIVMIGNYLNIF